MNELARQASYSEGHLSSEFRHYFGVSIIQFALRLRMKHASYLLRNRNHRISEIASAVGYPDIFTFSKMFKRHMGVSPSDFRKRVV